MSHLQCVDQVLTDEADIVYFAFADCTRGLLRDTLGRVLEHAGRNKYGIRWLDDDGKDIGNCGGSCNDTVSTIQFELMCPFFGR